MIIRFLNTSLFFLITLVIYGQQINKKDFKVYRTKDGLSNKSINATIQDSYGYIWIATEKGLNRFDGSGFQQFFSDSLPESLLEDRVFNLKWINNEELGLLTGAGLNIINTRTLQMRALIIPTDSIKDRSRVNRVLDIAADKKRNIFLLTLSGFYHFNNNNLIFRYDHPNKSNTFGWDVIKVNNNNLLLSTSDGLFIYNIERKDLHKPSNNDDAFLRTVASPEIRFRFKYADETLFGIGHKGASLTLFDILKKTKQTISEPPGFTRKLNFSGQVYRLNDTILAALSTGSGFHIIKLDKQTSLWSLDTTLYFENDFCTSIFVDKNNHLWIGTTNGLYKQSKIGTRIEQAQLPGEGGTPQASVTGLAVANNKIFASTAFEGVYAFDKNQLSLSRQIAYPSGPNYIAQLLKVNEDSLISAGKLFLINTHSLENKKIEQENVLSTGVIKSIFKDSHNSIYFIKTRVDTLYYKNSPDKDFSAMRLPDLQKIRETKQIAEDNDGNLWFGGYGLLRFNKSAKKIDFHIDSFPSIKNPNIEITSNIVFDKAGRMYFGVFGNGLIIYDTREKTFSHLARSAGLPDNVIKALYLHDNGTLWIATENGLANYDIHSKKISAFGASDAMPNELGACTALYFDTTDHFLYAAFSPTIIRFDPATMKKNNLPPSFFIESIDITGNGSLYYPGDVITVQYKHNNVAINLAAINFEDAPQQLFAYRVLNNGNELWQELGTQRRILFNDLPVGKHKLQVKVYIRNKSWEDQVKEITIIVKPPFWKTIWFYLAVSLLIAAILYSLHRQRIKKITQKVNVDKLLAQTEMKALHAQMNPHFIFNCLNSIREMILNNENEQASLYLSKFARLIRITLNQSSKQFVSLADTIDYLERYIEMEKIRTTHFLYTLDVSHDLNIDDIMVPPMLIQPFIENAIWHGPSQKKDLEVNIRLSRTADQLVCSIEDNGIGIDESLRKKESITGEPSVGINNIKQRIHLLNEKYNLHSTVKIEDRSTLTENNGTGTIVTLHLPIKTNENLWNN